MTPEQLNQILQIFRDLQAEGKLSEQEANAIRNRLSELSNRIMSLTEFRRAAGAEDSIDFDAVVSTVEAAMQAVRTLRTGRDKIAELMKSLQDMGALGGEDYEQTFLQALEETGMTDADVNQIIAAKQDLTGSLRQKQGLVFAERLQELQREAADRVISNIVKTSNEATSQINEMTEETIKATLRETTAGLQQGRQAQMSDRNLWQEAERMGAFKDEQFKQTMETALRSGANIRAPLEAQVETMRGEYEERLSNLLTVEVRRREQIEQEILEGFQSGNETLEDVVERAAAAKVSTDQILQQGRTGSLSEDEMAQRLARGAAEGEVAADTEAQERARREQTGASYAGLMSEKARHRYEQEQRMRSGYEAGDLTLEDLMSQARESGMKQPQLDQILQQGAAGGMEESAMAATIARETAERQATSRFGEDDAFMLDMMQRMAPAMMASAIDFGTPGGGSMVEASGQAFQSAASLGGLGAATMIGGMPGLLAAAGISSFGQVADPIVGHYRQQAELNTMFGTGMEMNPFGALGEDPEGTQMVQRAQISARLTNLTVSGQQIDELTQALAELGTDAATTAQAVKDGAKAMQEYGLTAEAAAMLTRFGAAASPLGTGEVDVYGRTTQNLVQETGVNRQQLEAGRAAAVEGAPGQVFGAVEAGYVSAGYESAIAEMPDEEQAIAEKEGTARSLTDLAAMLVTDPASMASLQQMGPEVLSKDPKSTEGKMAIASAMTSLILRFGRPFGTNQDGTIPYNFMTATQLSQFLPESGQFPDMTALEFVNLYNQLIQDPNWLTNSVARTEKERDRATIDTVMETAGGGQQAAAKEKGMPFGGQGGRNLFSGDWGAIEDNKFVGADVGFVADVAQKGAETYSWLDRQVQKVFPSGDKYTIGEWLGDLSSEDPEKGMPSNKTYELWRQTYGGPLGALSAEGDLNPNTIRLAGSDMTVGELASEANGQRGGLSVEEARRRLASVQRGEERIQLQGGGRGGEGYTAMEVSRMREAGQLEIGDDGQLKFRADADTEPRALDVNVRETEWLRKFFNIGVTDKSSGAGRFNGAQEEHGRNYEGNSLNQGKVKGTGQRSRKS